MDPLFPKVPAELSEVSDEDIRQLLADHEAAAELIDSDDDEFLKGLSADEIIEQYAAGVEQIKVLRAENKEREAAHENFVAKREELKAARSAADAVEEPAVEEEPAEDDAPVEVMAEEPEQAEEPVEEPAEERVLVTASVAKPRYARTPPAPAPNRIAVSTPEPQGAALVAAGEMSLKYRDPLTPHSLATLVRDSAVHHGPHPKVDPPGKYRFGGPEYRIAHAEFAFPEERTLTGNIDEDAAKIKAVIPETSLPGFGKLAGEALVASGGLCAPLTPVYTMPNFASEAEPVWDALPVFMASRGGVNVPDATYIGDITTAISSISESDDALGGTYATKSCQDLSCPDYTEVAIQILAHCREYGNLNARAWPEKIAHENALTMAALARTSEGFMLDRIKALSINTTTAQTLGSVVDLVYAITRAASSIRSVLRMSNGARFRALLPQWLPDLMVADTISTQFDRFRNQASLVDYLRSIGIDPVFYMDTPSTGTSQQFSAETASAVDDFPDDVQWALYPEGTFLGVDSGTLELGIVRDSTLNSTNDFQVFGERFRNVALLGPAQAARWVTSTVCPTGEFPSLATALSCS